MKKGIKDDMTSLEFINQNIFECKNHIEHLETQIIEDKKYPSLVKAHKERIEELKPILKQLQQIKSVLEAWEICKKYHHINKYNGKRFDITIWLNTENCGFKSCASYEECLKVKKELEVEDE